MGHDEDGWQLIPLIVIALAVASTVGFAIAGSRSSATSVVIRAFWSVIRAKAPPALAPSTLILLGLIGLVVAFRR